MTEPSLWSFISNASLVVKFVLFILFLASIVSWTCILERALYFKQLKRDNVNFDNRFWSPDVDLVHLFKEFSDNNRCVGLARIFHTGFKECRRSFNINNIKRTMRIAVTQEINAAEKQLNFLATVGSTSPYVGLFGTVWGIMSAFRALGVASQATIPMIAPGIAEALIATAIGLFAAIPAVIAYNRLSNKAECIATEYETFQEELMTLFEHQIEHQINRNTEREREIKIEKEKEKERDRIA